MRRENSSPLQHLQIVVALRKTDVPQAIPSPREYPASNKGKEGSARGQEKGLQNGIGHGF